jgi:hypothetical protein
MRTLSENFLKEAVSEGIQVTFVISSVAATSSTLSLSLSLFMDNETHVTYLPTATEISNAFINFC